MNGIDSCGSDACEKTCSDTLCYEVLNTANDYATNLIKLYNFIIGLSILLEYHMLFC